MKEEKSEKKYATKFSPNEWKRAQKEEDEEGEREREKKKKEWKKKYNENIMIRFFDYFGNAMKNLNYGLVHRNHKCF